LATHIELTEVDIDIEGDTRFPQLDLSQWREVRREPARSGDLSYAFVTLERVVGLSLGL